MGSLLEYKCPACGGTLEFNSGIQKMKCPYCETEFEMESLKEYDEALNAEQSADMKWETEAGGQWQDGETDDMRTYICQSCGGEIITDADTSATNCPYCGNQIIMTGNLSGVLKPDYVIPFKLDKEAAKKGLINHLKGKKLLPKVFKDQNHIDEIKGVYVPVWLFNTKADADVRYKATRVRVWSDSRYDYTETSFYSVFRKGSLDFNHVPVDGSTKMENNLMESIEPFRFEDAVDFQTAYLSGYLADKYDVTADESINRANERIKRSTEDTFISTVRGYATVIPENSNIRLKNSKAVYALYPVWLLNTTWNEKKYVFIMNGQTGKFAGDLPIDKAAYWRWFGIVTAITAIATYGLAWLIHLL